MTAAADNLVNHGADPLVGADRPVRRGRFGWLLLANCLVAAGLAIIAFGFYWRSEWQSIAARQPPVERYVLLLTAVAVGVLVRGVIWFRGRAFSTKGYRWWAIPTIAAAGWLGWWGGSWFFPSIFYGLPHVVGALLTLGSTAVVAGFLAGFPALGQRWSAQFRPATVLTCLLVVATLAVGSWLTATTADAWTSSSSPAAGAVAIPAAPASISAAGWTKLFDGATDLNAGGPGLIVTQDDTVTGFAEATGAPVWSYQQRFAGPLRVELSPDRATAYVQVGGVLTPNNTVILDAATGAVRARTNLSIPWRGYNIGDQVVASADLTGLGPYSIDTNESRQVIAKSAQNGAVLWTHPLDTDCQFWDVSQGEVRAVGDLFVVIQTCAGNSLRLDALDQVTGDAHWSWTAQPTAPADRRDVQVETDPAAVFVSSSNDVARLTTWTTLDVTGTATVTTTDVDREPDALAQGYRDLGATGFRGVLADQVVGADRGDDPTTVRVRTWPRPFDDRAESTNFEVAVDPPPAGTELNSCAFSTSLLAAPGGAYLVTATDCGQVPNGVSGEQRDVSVTVLQ